MRRLLLFTILACLVVPCAAAAAPYTPPSGKVFHSGIGGYGPGSAQAFGQQSGKNPAIYQYFAFGEYGVGAPRARAY